MNTRPSVCHKNSGWILPLVSLVRQIGHCKRRAANKTPARTHAHTHTHARTHARTRTRTHAHARTHIHTHTRAHTRTHAHTRTYTYTHTRTHANTHTHTHTTTNGLVRGTAAHPRSSVVPSATSVGKDNCEQGQPLARATVGRGNCDQGGHDSALRVRIY